MEKTASRSPLNSKRSTGRRTRTWPAGHWRISTPASGAASIRQSRAELAAQLGACHPFFAFPVAVRRINYTTNAIRSLNADCGAPCGQAIFQPMRRRSNCCISSCAKLRRNMENTATRMVRGQDPIRHHVRRQIRQSVMAKPAPHTRFLTVPAKMKTRTGRLWTYVRDDRPFGGPASPAAIFYYSSDRDGVHPSRHLASYTGILQADSLWRIQRETSTKRTEDRAQSPRPRVGAMGVCEFFELADITKAARGAVTEKARRPGQCRWRMKPVRRIDLIFDARARSQWTGRC